MVSAVGAVWDIAVERSCDVHVEVVAAVEEPFAGSEFEIRAGEAVLRGELAATGGWHAFHAFRLGSPPHSITTLTFPATATILAASQSH